MISFLVALAALIAGYMVYGTLVDRVFGPSDRKTPAVLHNDGVDYIPLPTWKVFLIQLLNIAGLGPIFLGLWVVHSGDHRFTSGSYWEQFLLVVYMIIFPV